MQAQSRQSFLEDKIASLKPYAGNSKPARMQMVAAQKELDALRAASRKRQAEFAATPEGQKAEREMLSVAAAARTVTRACFRALR